MSNLYNQLGDSCVLWMMCGKRRRQVPRRNPIRAEIQASGTSRPNPNLNKENKNKTDMLKTLALYAQPRGIKLSAPGALLILLFLLPQQTMALASKFRVIWYQDPASTAVIAWDQVSGEDPVVHIDVNDFGNDIAEYGLKKRADIARPAKGMNNHFLRLKGLIPNMTYYFIVKDSEGQSRRMFFTTAPSNPEQRLSIIAGGDSRNHREARRDANLLVAKLKPHCVMFGGDFTGGDTAEEWQEWFEDWQVSIARDGRVTPIIVTRGNHEESNQVLVDLFDLDNPGAYYAFNIGGNLARIYTLNTLIPAGGSQKDWLEGDLSSHADVAWKLGQYHHPMRPHTEKKGERNDLVTYWAPLFERYGMNLAVECDAHVAKSTYPIRPENGAGSDEGFVRDDQRGTVYVGEGCWGAPLRENNDDKSWTRASGSFNHFNWIFIDQSRMEVRIVKTDGAEMVAEVKPSNIFLPPVGLSIWNPPTGDVIVIERREGEHPFRNEEILVARGSAAQDLHSKQGMASDNPLLESRELDNWEACPMIAANVQSGELALKFALDERGPVVVRLVNTDLKEVFRKELDEHEPGEYLKRFAVGHLAPGRYLAIIKDSRKILRRYRVVKN